MHSLLHTLQQLIRTTTPTIIVENKRSASQSCSFNTHAQQERSATLGLCTAAVHNHVLYDTCRLNNDRLLFTPPNMSLCVIQFVFLSPPGTRLHRSAAAPLLLPIDSIERSPPFPLPAAANPSLLLTADTSSSPRTAADTSVPGLHVAVLGCPGGPPPATRGSRPSSFRWGPRRSAGMATGGARDSSTQCSLEPWPKPGEYGTARTPFFFAVPSSSNTSILPPPSGSTPHAQPNTTQDLRRQTSHAFFFT